MQLGNFIKGFKQFEGEPASHSWQLITSEFLKNEIINSGNIKMIEINNVNDRSYTISDVYNVIYLQNKEIYHVGIDYFYYTDIFYVELKTKSGKRYYAQVNNGGIIGITNYSQTYFSSWGQPFDTIVINDIDLLISNLKIVAPIGEVIDSIICGVSFSFYNTICHPDSDSMGCETIGNSTIIATPTIVNL